MHFCGAVLLWRCTSCDDVNMWWCIEKPNVLLTKIVLLWFLMYSCGDVLLWRCLLVMVLLLPHVPLSVSTIEVAQIDNSYPTSVEMLEGEVGSKQAPSGRDSGATIENTSSRMPLSAQLLGIDHRWQQMRNIYGAHSSKGIENTLAEWVHWKLMCSWQLHWAWTWSSSPMAGHEVGIETPFPVQWQKPSCLVYAVFEEIGEASGDALWHICGAFYWSGPDWSYQHHWDNGRGSRFNTGSQWGSRATSDLEPDASISTSWLNRAEGCLWGLARKRSWSAALPFGMNMVFWPSRGI